MTYRELIKVVAKRKNISQVEVEVILDAVVTEIRGQLKRKKDVTLADFGVFSVGSSAARNIRNIRTQQPMRIPALNVVKFKAGGNLKASLN